MRGNSSVSDDASYIRNRSPPANNIQKDGSVSGLLPIGGEFPLSSEGSLRAEFDQRKAFQPGSSRRFPTLSLSTLCQPLPDFRKEDQSDKELIAALAKSLCQSLADAFYSFLAAKQSLRKEFSIFTAIPIRELLNSYFLDPSLFGKDEVARVTAEARNLHCSIKEFLDRTAGKSKLVSNVA